MIVKKIKKHSRGTRTKLVLEMICDNCKIKFTTDKKISYHEKRDTHFCSLKCSAGSKLTIEKRIASTKKKYGVDHAIQSSVIKNKREKTNISRYGSKCTLQNKIVAEKTKKTSLEKYGVKIPSQSTQAIEKRKNTCIEKYGTEHALGSQFVIEKRKRNLIEKSGVKNVSQIASTRDKVKETNLKRYGVENTFSIQKAKERANSKNAILKRHKTMKANGTYGKSKSEDNFYEFLIASFQHKVIDRQVIVNGWNIDFKVENIFIQFDGEYYHGLDRPIELIKEFKTPTDRTIYKTYLRDKAQNLWFIENNKILIRITDKEFEQDKTTIYNKILEAMND